MPGLLNCPAELRRASVWKCLFQNSKLLLQKLGNVIALTSQECQKARTPIALKNGRCCPHPSLRPHGSGLDRFEVPVHRLPADPDCLGDLLDGQFLRLIELPGNLDLVWGHYWWA